MEPKSSRNGPRRALKDPKNHPRRRLEKLLAIMVDPEDSKKACWWPRSTQESLLEAKISPRSRFGVILGSILGAFFLHMFGSKIGSKFGYLFGVVFCSVLVQKSDPNRPREPSTWHWKARRSAKMSSVTPCIRRYGALLKSCTKNTTVLGLRPRANQNGPKRP